MKSRPHPLSLLAALFSALSAVPVDAATLPVGFSDETVARGLDTPTDLAIAPDGRIFVALKRGTVMVASGQGLQSTPFVSIDPEVNNAGERGLMSIAVDPDFAHNGYVYLLYNVDRVYGDPEEPADQPTWSRLTRYTASSQSGATVADVSSRTVLIGVSSSDGIPSCANSQTIGAMRFALDGTLFISTGDGASEDFVDYGQNVNQYSAECEQLFGDTQDVGVLRSQSLDSLAGKLLRIDPADGKGLADNPFYAGDRNAFAAFVWAYGLRQPFRFGVRPGSSSPGTVLIGDVGSSQFEELDVVQRGLNYGWPCWEGDQPDYLYQQDAGTSAACATMPLSVTVRPALEWSHSEPLYAGFTGACVIGGAFYTGKGWPSSYQGHYFFADYTEGWIRSAPMTSADALGASSLFASSLEAPVALTVSPQTGDLFYVSISKGEVHAIRYEQTEHAPVAVAAASPSSGGAPLTVALTGSGSSDADGETLSYTWSLGDGGASNQADLTHVYALGGTYTATLTVTDPGGRTDSASVVIAVDNTPPIARIEAPEDGSSFTIPGQVSLVGAATDAEQSPLPDSAYRWVVDMHHDTHIHYDWFVATGPTATLGVESHGDGEIWFEISLIVTDGGGLSGKSSASIHPISTLDSDEDGLDDQQEQALGTDPFIPDTDLDGLSDGEEVLIWLTDPLEADTDGDGLNDGREVDTTHTDPLEADTDGDGLNDGREVDTTHTDPLEADTDGDGLNDGREVGTTHTDPLKADTDGDGLNDGREVDTTHTDPLEADTDGDGLNDGREVDTTHTDPLEADTDGDGYSDGDELAQGTDPLSADSYPSTGCSTGGSTSGKAALVLLLAVPLALIRRRAR